MKPVFSMRILTQNIKAGTIKVAQQTIAQIGNGLALFIGFCHDDDFPIINKMIDKVLALRLFADSSGKTNLSIQDIDGQLLVIPNFTLYGSVSGGRRPSFTASLGQEQAKIYFEYVMAIIRQKYPKVAFGLFGADMEICLVNDGPFSLFLDSNDLFGTQR